MAHIASTSSHQGLGLFDSFLQALRGEQAGTLAHETTLGAVTHYLTTLPTSRTAELVQALLVWDANTDAGEGHASESSPRLQESIRAGVVGRVARIHARWEGTTCAARTFRTAARKWLFACVDGLGASQSDSPGRARVIFGLLRGLADRNDVDWGSKRAWLAEQAVLYIAAADARNDTQNTVGALVYVSPALPARLLRVLKLPAIANLLFRELGDLMFDALSNAPPSESSNGVMRIRDVSATLARLVAVLEDDGPSARAQCCDIGRLLCAHIHDLQPIGPSRSRISQGTRQVLLQASLPLALAVVDVLLTDSRSASLGVPTDDLALDLLASLSTLGRPPSEDADLSEQYESAIQGCTQLVSRDSTGALAKLLFRRLSPGIDDPDCAAFALDLGRRLIHCLHGGTVVTQLIPLTSYMLDPEHKAAFDAAHSFVLAFLGATHQTLLDEGQSQGPAVTELVPYYSQVVLTFRRGLLEQGFLVDNFPRIMAAATATSVALAKSTMALLQPNEDEEQSLKSTLLLIRLACTPHLPPAVMLTHLEQCGEVMAALPTADRAKPVAALQAAIAEVPDHLRPAILRWWMAYQHSTRGARPPSLLARL